jgi:transposase-like protein
MLGHVTRAQQPLVSGAIRGIFTATTAAEARARLAQVSDQLRPHAPKVAALLEDAEAELLAFYAFPAEHWPKLRSTNPLERSTARSAAVRTWWGSSCVLSWHGCRHGCGQPRGSRGG